MLRPALAAPRRAARRRRAVHVCGPAPRDARSPARLSRRSAGVRGALHAPPRRRIPGHRPAAGRDPPVPDERRPRREGRDASRAQGGISLRRGRPQAVHLPVPPRRHRGVHEFSPHARRLRRAHRPARGELPGRPHPHGPGERLVSKPLSGGGQRPPGLLRPARARAKGPIGEVRRVPAPHPVGDATADESRARTRPTSRASSGGRRSQVAGGVRRPRARRALRRLPRPDADARAPRRLRARLRGARYSRGRVGKQGAPDLEGARGAAALPRGDPGSGRRRLGRRVPFGPALGSRRRRALSDSTGPGGASPISSSLRRERTRGSPAGWSSSRRPARTSTRIRRARPSASSATGSASSRASPPGPKAERPAATS